MVNFHTIGILSQSIGLAILSGILMNLGWPDNDFYPLLFIGLIPLFFAIDQLELMASKWKLLLLFFIVFCSHIVWTGMSLRWLHETSPKTYQVAIVIDALTLSLILSPLFLIKKYAGEKLKWVYFVAAWMTMEYFNQHWMLGAPYFILGSGFGKAPELIQCYEFIGIEGGSIFLLMTNIAGYKLLKNTLKRESVKKSIVLLSIGLFPFVFSLFLGNSVDEFKQEKIKVVAVHSFLDTYHDDSHKYPQRSVERLWDITKKAQLDNVELVVWPETIISNMGWLNNIVNEGAYKSLSDKLKEFPQLSVCLGGYGFSLAKDGAVDPYAAFDEKRKFYYQAHNVAITMNNGSIWPIRSKEIFIPFQERIPFLETLPFLKNFADIVGSNTMVSPYTKGSNIHRTIKGSKFVPVLCFESTYPLRMASNAEESDFIAILANENWNKDLSGSEQYLYSNVGMAIQSRTSIVRSSNSGISAIINSYGEIVGRRKGKDIGVIEADILPKEELTFYESISGLLYKLSSFIFVASLIFGMFNWIFRNKKTY